MVGGEECQFVAIASRRHIDTCSEVGYANFERAAGRYSTELQADFEARWPPAMSTAFQWVNSPIRSAARSRSAGMPALRHGLCRQILMPSPDVVRIPASAVSTGESPEFTLETLPDALQRQHELAPGRWARLSVLEGELTFFDLDGGESVSVRMGSRLEIGPSERHRVELGAGGRIRLEFFRVPEPG